MKTIMHIPIAKEDYVLSDFERPDTAACSAFQGFQDDYAKVIVKSAGNCYGKTFKIAAPSATVKYSVWDCDHKEEGNAGRCLQLKVPCSSIKSLMFDCAQDEYKALRWVQEGTAYRIRILTSLTEVCGFRSKSKGPCWLLLMPRWVCGDTSVVNLREQ